ncbi:carboxypeptidase-like regulatory domain-containing protein [Pontibacter sp. G13]|uniref:carboxypeptidase-like regulatory domain-containing protein n=1 Tax=Pontibacter sp. G13 TaxID=3074898 RepID=UPI002889D4A6|nr:carboxypeptidase-like regulatory domain-containing protein [Pontibacter sp. G13]WNJ16821.1 carboxypeptidase-like regulatory domain-containing protein [Pontibacter sp. G13]
MRFFHFLLGFLLLAAIPAQAQTISFSGKVTDANTGKPLAFAQLRAVNAKMGSVSNADGYFLLRFRSKDIQGDTLMITYIGYEPILMPMDPMGIGEELDIRMETASFSIDSVLIVPFTPQELIKQALVKVEENYQHSPSLSRGFYRELVQENEQYVTFNEAVLDVYQTSLGMEARNNNQVRLVKGRSKGSKQSIFGDDFAMGGGGPHEISGRPVIGEMIVQHFLDSANFKYYEYELVGRSLYEGREVYEIHFQQDRKKRQLMYDGVIYIDAATRAFAAIDWHFSTNGKKFRIKQIDDVGAGAGAALALAKLLFGFDFDLMDHSGRLAFQIENGKWYMSYAQEEARFWLKIPTKFMDEMNDWDEEDESMEGMSDAEKKKIKKARKKQFKEENPKHMEGTYWYNRQLAFTSRDVSPGGEIPESERLKKDQELEKFSGEYNDSFWDEYNIIAPSQSLREIIEALDQSAE